MGHEDHVKGVFLQIGLHFAQHPLVGGVDGGVDGQTAVLIAQLVNDPEQPRRPLRNLDIGVSDLPVQIFPRKLIGVEHDGMMSPQRQGLFDGGGSGIVTAAGAAGQNQRIQSSFTSGGVFSSLLVSIRAATAAKIRLKPIQMQRSREKTYRRSSAPR